MVSQGTIILHQGRVARVKPWGISVMDSPLYEKSNLAMLSNQWGQVAVYLRAECVMQKTGLMHKIVSRPRGQ